MKLNNTIRPAYIFIFFFLLSPALLMAQEHGEHGESETHEIENKNGIYASFGYSFIGKGADIDNLNDRGHFVPSIGIDYVRVINSKWSFGAFIDFELGSYIVRGREDLEREKAIIVAAVLGYELFHRWKVYGGIGREFEKHKNLTVVRLGIEHSVFFEKNWFMPFGVFYDIKEGYDVFTLNIGIGKTF